MAKIERKYLAHYIDTEFVNYELESPTGTPSYFRLGKDLEEYNDELNPDVEVVKNILGEQNIRHNGYEVQSEVDTFYAEYDDPLFEKLFEIANKRQTGDQVKTSKVDVLLKEDGTVIEAWRENVAVIPNSVGGDTSGMQIPFTVYNLGGRVKGTWNMSSKTFTAETTT